MAAVAWCVAAEIVNGQKTTVGEYRGNSLYQTFHYEYDPLGRLTTDRLQDSSENDVYWCNADPGWVTGSLGSTRTPRWANMILRCPSGYATLRS